MIDDENVFENSTFEEKMALLYNTLTEQQKRENLEQVKFMCLCCKCPTIIEQVKIN